jgi:hypothetical protein
MSWIFWNLKPALSVELGSSSGDSFWALCQIADRFNRGSRTVGIDPWRTPSTTASQHNPVFEELRERCATHHADTATLLRMELNAAASEFEDKSVDLLHIAPRNYEADNAPLDLTTWRPKLRPGGVIVITGSKENSTDDSERKLWRLLSEMFPAVLVSASHLAGIAQIPHEGEAPLVELLEKESGQLSLLFRLLGERVEYRHVIGSDPISARGLRMYLSGLLAEHAALVHHMEEQHRSEIEDRDLRIISVNEQLIARAYEVNERQAEADALLARLSKYAAEYEREREGLRAQVEELHRERGIDIATLTHEINLREIRINTIMATRSWQVTKPLRAIQALLIRLKRLGRPT